MKEYKIFTRDDDWTFKTDADEEAIRSTLALLKTRHMYGYCQFKQILRVLGFECEEVKFKVIR